MIPCCICGPAERPKDGSAFLFLRSSSSCMIFSAIVMLLGGFDLLVEMLADPALPEEPSRFDVSACLSGFDALDVDLRTLKPILNGAGAEEAGSGFVVVGPDVDGRDGAALSKVVASSVLCALDPRRDLYG